ncbi:DUF5309 family protein [Enterobacter hormaechei]
MLYSYDLQGVKDSFSDWISNISPEDTFIVSNTKKEQAKTTAFKWQTDSLNTTALDFTLDESNFYNKEGKEDDFNKVNELQFTKEKKGYTQIFLKTINVSDTALASSSHGRANELKYQLEKAGKELKTNMERVFCSSQEGRTTNFVTASSGLLSMIAKIDIDNPDLPSPTKAGDYAVHKKDDLTFASLDAISFALYASGSKAKYILVNPINATSLNKARDEAVTAKVEQYKITDKSNPDREFEIPTITDSRGKTWEIVYSRFVPVDLVYFIDPDSIKQFVLREPKATQLGKNGSFETWQLVIEAGLAVLNPYACGALEITTTKP